MSRFYIAVFSFVLACYPVYSSVGQKETSQLLNEQLMIVNQELERLSEITMKQKDTLQTQRNRLLELSRQLDDAKRSLSNLDNQNKKKMMYTSIVSGLAGILLGSVVTLIIVFK